VILRTITTVILEDVLATCLNTRFIFIYINFNKKGSVESPFLSEFSSVPYRTPSYRTVPFRTVPYRTAAYHLSFYRRESEFIRLPCPYGTVPYRTVPYRVRTIPYRFPRGTVLVDREAYRTFLTVFRDFCLKARTLPRFKFYRSAV
jgi:hypothetical protein